MERVDGHMKLSELKPCNCCKGPLLSPGVIQWYVIRQTMAMLKPNATNQVLGLTRMLGGSLDLAEVMAPDDKPVVILGDHEKEMMTEVHICFTCWCSEKFDGFRSIVGE